jgi:hypothetical protein
MENKILREELWRICQHGITRDEIYIMCYSMIFAGVCFLRLLFKKQAFNSVIMGVLLVVAVGQNIDYIEKEVAWKTFDWICDMTLKRYCG